MEQLCPDCEFVTSEHKVEWRFRCQEFLAHGSDKIGRIRLTSGKDFGPHVDGFRIRLSWSHTAGEGSAWGGWGSTIGRSYWTDYPNFYRLKDGAGYVRMDFSFGKRTDMNVLTTLQKELSKSGKQMYGPSTMFIKPVDDWDEKSMLLLGDLKQSLGQYHPETKWRRDQQSLVSEYRTTTYDIHAKDELGNISPKAHQETGPLHDGLIVRVSRLEKHVGGNTRAVQGRNSRRYWQHYFVVYQRYGTPVRLDLMYGRRTSHEAIQAALSAVDKHFGTYRSRHSQFGLWHSRGWSDPE